MKIKSSQSVSNLRELGSGKNNFNNIKAYGNIFTQKEQPVSSASPDKIPFSFVDLARRRAHELVTGAFDFRENESILLSADDIDFAPVPSAEVAPQNDEAASSKPAGSDQFAVATEKRAVRDISGGPRAAPSVQQVQTCGDDVA